MDFQAIFTSFWFESVVRLILGFFLAGVIGAERESVNKPAGFRTHSLIGISAVLIMLCGQYLSKTHGVDASRIPAQLLSGIGFIGAGTILRDGFNVKGLTTASSLLAITCIGLSIGAGFYIGGIFATAIVYIILAYSHSMFDSLDHFSNLQLNLLVKNSEETLTSIQKILDKHKTTIKKIKHNEKTDDNNQYVQLSFRYHRDNNLNAILTEISSLENVLELEEG